MADGSIRLSQWRWLSFYENEAEIKDVWNANLDGHDTRVQDVADFARRILWPLARSSTVLAGAQSLREIESGLASHAHRLYHLGTRPVSHSTLGDANATRPSEVFGALFAHLVAQAGRGVRRMLLEKAYRAISPSGALVVSDLMGVPASMRCRSSRNGCLALFPSCSGRS